VPLLIITVPFGWVPAGAGFGFGFGVGVGVGVGVGLGVKGPPPPPSVHMPLTAVIVIVSGPANEAATEALATRDALQVTDTDPPLAAAVAVRLKPLSTVMSNDEPAGTVTTTLLVLTTKVVAADPAKIVKVVAGLESKTDVSTVKLRSAAKAVLTNTRLIPNANAADAAANLDIFFMYFYTLMLSIFGN
jgi:hypothetical protein